MSLSFIVGGREVSERDLMDLAPKRKAKAASADLHRATTDRASAKLSLGFVAEGFSPAHLESAKRAHEALRADLLARQEAGKLGKNERVPREWDAEAYMLGAKPKRVRTKPYEVSSAADTCAELARKAGWLRVTVSELLRT